MGLEAAQAFIDGCSLTSSFSLQLLIVGPPTLLSFRLSSSSYSAHLPLSLSLYLTRSCLSVKTVFQTLKGVL